MRLMEPLDSPGHYDSSDPFGNTVGRSYPHTGSDFNGVPAGTLAHAIGTGVVVNKQWHDGNGNTVTVRLPDGHYYAYLHLQEPALVNPGDQVTIGQYIGKVGNTGTNSIGAHLHITVSDSPSAYAGLGNKIDPWAFIQEHINDTDPATPPAEEEDMQLIRVIADTGTNDGSIFGSTGVITAHTGFVKTSSGLESRAELEAWTSIANVLGYTVTEKHVDNNGFLLAQRL